MEKEKILKNGQKMWEKGKNAGYRLGRKDDFEEGAKLAGHGEGLCILREAHIHKLWQGAILLDEAQVQTDPEMTTWSDTSTQAAPRTDERPPKPRRHHSASNSVQKPLQKLSRQLPRPMLPPPLTSAPKPPLVPWKWPYNPLKH
jgi:hypothetical protein